MRKSSTTHRFEGSMRTWYATTSIRICTKNNRVAVASGHKAFPIIIYVDGVPTTKRDGELAFWCYILGSKKRHLVCSVRKSRLRRCGCKGWCSIWPIWRLLHWSLKSLARRQFPILGPGLEPLTELHMKAVAGNPMEISGALYGFKGDLLEYSGTFGFPPNI